MVCLAATAPLDASGSTDGASIETLHENTWVHATPAAVISFVLFISPTPDSAATARKIDVGKPGGSDLDSAQFFSALIPLAGEEFVAVAAVGQTGLLSVLSEWSQPQPTRPGQPLVVEP